MEVELFCCSQWFDRRRTVGYQIVIRGSNHRKQTYILNVPYSGCLLCNAPPLHSVLAAAGSRSGVQIMAIPE
jgi:hypothetical protein